LHVVFEGLIFYCIRGVF